MQLSYPHSSLVSVSYAFNDVLFELFNARFSLSSTTYAISCQTVVFSQHIHQASTLRVFAFHFNSANLRAILLDDVVGDVDEVAVVEGLHALAADLQVFTVKVLRVFYGPNAATQVTAEDFFGLSLGHQ